MTGLIIMERDNMVYHCRDDACIAFAMGTKQPHITIFKKIYFNTIKTTFHKININIYI